MGRTLADVANTAIKIDPFFTENADRDRLWVHDMLHGVLNLPPNSARSEFEVGIYQAVLLRTRNVTTRRIPLQDGAQDVHLSHIYEYVLPGIEKFVTALALARGHKIRYRLTDHEIKSSYERACILNGLIEKEFGCRLGDMAVETLQAMPAERMQALVEQSEILWWKHFAEERYEGFGQFVSTTICPA